MKARPTRDASRPGGALAAVTAAIASAVAGTVAHPMFQPVYSIARVVAFRDRRPW